MGAPTDPSQPPFVVGFEFGEPLGVRERAGHVRQDDGLPLALPDQAHGQMLLGLEQTSVADAGREERERRTGGAVLGDDAFRLDAAAPGLRERAGEERGRPLAPNVAPRHDARHGIVEVEDPRPPPSKDTTEHAASRACLALASLPPVFCVGKTCWAS